MLASLAAPRWWACDVAPLGRQRASALPEKCRQELAGRQEETLLSADGGTWAAGMASCGLAWKAQKALEDRVGEA